MTVSKASSVSMAKTETRLLQSFLLFAVVVLVVQTIFWFGVYQPFLSTPPSAELDRVAFTDIRLSELPAPTPEAAAAADHQPVTLPHTVCCDPVYLSLMLDFTVAEVPPEGLGLLAYHQVDNMIIQVNGSVIAADGVMKFGRQTFEGQKGQVVRIPAGLLRPGANTLSFITVRDGFPYTDLYPPILAPIEQVEPWAARRLWQQGEYQLFAGWTTFILGLLATLIILRSRERSFAAWLAILCFSWSALAAYALVLDYPVGGTIRMIAFFAINSLVSTALLCFVDAWSRRPLPWLQPLAVLALTTLVLVSAYWLIYRPMPEGYDAPALIWSVFTTVMGVGVVLRLAWHFIRVREDRRIEAALLSVVAVCIVLDALGTYFGLNGGQYVIQSAPVLLFALVAAFIQRNFTLFQSARDLNAHLAERLAEREIELQAAQAREHDRVRLQAHNDERRRIMRDMHDGLGSQLMGMLLAARRGKAEPAAIAEGLQSVIDEMRLMIDSMDSVGESLASALTTFQDRVRPRIEAAGFVLTWNSLLDTPLPDYPPRVVLQVFRILQEAVNNTLKHSGGDRIEIGVGPGGEAGTVRVNVSDNGKGYSEASTPGHGLRNMRTRATLIGASLTIDASDAGTDVILILRPVPREP
ncbi:ATP-binding protein [Brevundimonas variabilis]|uniref:Signal transduction histidine kinase n=1 Tax=Brevundimonas variabilis TaxID=74312 RepID=A0A7W9FFS8_9CAUL|nr:ATP-binding protein [Brevundimonas variabilis]MBB5747685.1 signal transduction histidine kinase [Brevundimonas variabilis]